MSKQTSNAAAYDWGAALKSDVSAVQVEGGKPSRGPIPVGRHPARISDVKLETFKKGSYGLRLEYTLEGTGVVGRTINEYIVLRKADGTATEYGGNNIKRRLLVALSPEQMTKFKQPKNDQDIGDFRLLFGAPVLVNIADDGMYNERPARKVKGVYQRADE